MDNADPKKEAVSRTYQGVDGDTPIALYLGNEGWNNGLELRAGSHHLALETEYFLARAWRGGACAGVHCVAGAIEEGGVWLTTRENPMQQPNFAQAKGDGSPQGQEMT